MRSWECEEADDRRVEEIARQLEGVEQDGLSADWANNRERDDRRIEANVGRPPSNIREYLDELIKSFAPCPAVHPRPLKTLYDRKDYPAMLGCGFRSRCGRSAPSSAHTGPRRPRLLIKPAHECLLMARSGHPTVARQCPL
jgi:hypothetical protein